MTAGILNIKETIFQDQDSVLLTGATLTSFNSPEEFCNQIGIDYLDEYRTNKKKA